MYPRTGHFVSFGALPVFDPAEVRARGEELAAFIRAATAHYRLDAGRLTALGYSNGANIASTGRCHPQVAAHRPQSRSQ
ncbi:MAG: hypothetical protein H0T21_00170 [Gemmatimonadaceae bacterium]|nr:hypothetical protein [Gemmatimonadaceae bacterium]